MILGTSEIYSFRERVNNMGARTGDETDNHEEGDDDEEGDDFGSQLSFNSSIHEDEMPVSVEGGSSDQLGTVITINTASNEMQVIS